MWPPLEAGRRQCRPTGLGCRSFPEAPLRRLNSRFDVIRESAKVTSQLWMCHKTSTSERLQHRLDENMPRSRRGFLGWMVAAAAAVLVAGSIEVGRSSIFSRPELRSEHAKPEAGIPPDMVVVVSTDGKIFHRRGCRFIHDKAHVQTFTAREALRQGCVPCVRCMKEYLPGG